MSRFELAPPRRFVLPAILLLLSERPGYGYGLVPRLQEFRFGHVDRPAVYRALAQLERDGLVEASAGEPDGGHGQAGVPDHGPGRAGPAGVDGRDQGGARLPRRGPAPLSGHRDDRRRPGRGRRGLGDRARVGVVAGVGDVGRPPPVVPLVTVSDWRRGRAGRLGAERQPVGPHRARRPTPRRLPAGPRALGGADRGPLDRWTTQLRRHRRYRMRRGGDHRRGGPTLGAQPSGRIAVDVAGLRSGNGLYDAELLRRIDARRFPTATVELRRLRTRAG